MDLYSKYSNIVTGIIAGRAPVYEKASVDEHYIDLTGMDRFFGCLKWAQELRRDIIKQTGLPISSGLSVNKTVSKIATGEAKPNGEKEVPGELVRPFLNPLPISRIPMIGDKTFHLLRSMGVATIGTLSQIPMEMMEKVLGRNGIDIWKKANGIDSTPVIPYWEQKSISSERTFDTDTTDLAMLNNTLVGMVEKIAYELRREEKLTSCITVKIRYSNFDTHTLQQRIPYTSFDHKLIELAKSLFVRLYQRRMLIRLIGVKFSHLVRGTPQLNLFEDTPEMVRLYQEIDRMRLRYGKKAVVRAVGMKSVESR
jgi:DNA polymerase-4